MKIAYVSIGYIVINILFRIEQPCTITALETIKMDSLILKEGSIVNAKDLVIVLN